MDLTESTRVPAGVLLLTLASFLPVLAEDRPERKPPPSTIGPFELIVDGDEVHALLPPDGIPAITDPEFVTAEEADRFYSDDEPILGVAIEGEARAYSLWHLDRHEIVNDTVGGRHLAATW